MDTRAPSYFWRVCRGRTRLLACAAPTSASINPWENPDDLIQASPQAQARAADLAQEEGEGRREEAAAAPLSRSALLPAGGVRVERVRHSPAVTRALSRAALRSQVT